MDLLITILLMLVLFILAIPYINAETSIENEVSFTQTAVLGEKFTPKDLPFCEVAKCRKVKCFTYYQEVLGLWGSPRT